MLPSVVAVCLFRSIEPVSLIAKGSAFHFKIRQGRISVDFVCVPGVRGDRYFEPPPTGTRRRNSPRHNELPPSGYVGSTGVSR